MPDTNQVDISMLTPAQLGTYTRAFIDHRADYLILDGWQMQRQWVRDDLAQLTELGLLNFDEAASERESESQYTARCYRPTPAFVDALRAAGGAA